MANIVKVEDIMKIVGINNYIKSLSLDKQKLEFTGHELINNEIMLKFKYKLNSCEIYLDKNETIKQLNCDCSSFNCKYFCEHAALVVANIMENSEILNEITRIKNSIHDDDIIQKLFDSNTKNNLEKLNLEVILKKELDEKEYELILKIGTNKLYLLKKNLDQFIESYQSKTNQIYFGVNFVYDPIIQTFSKIDEQIIDFLITIHESKPTYLNYHYYYQPTLKYTLKGKSLKNFLELLENKPFKIENNGLIKKYKKVNRQLPFQMEIKENEVGIKLELYSTKYEPLTSDYEYIEFDNEIYNLEPKLGKILKLMKENFKKELLIKEKDYENFSKQIYNNIKEFDNVLIDSKIKEKFLIEDYKIKLYFEYNKNIIQAKANISIKNNEINMMSNVNKIDEVYFIRNLIKEQECINTLEKYNFKFNEQDKNFILEDENNIIEFIENGLNEIKDIYEVYTSKELVDVKIIKNVSIKSEFSMGKDNILKFDFKIENMDAKELDEILESIKLKKKYYKLKSGDYINVENKEITKLGNILDNLNVSSKSKKLGTAVISNYKSFYISSLDENQFINVDQSIKDLINNFNKYKNININISKNDKKILRDYQEIGVKWMMTISKCGFGGILADEMGLGKSIQTINYIKLKLKEKKGQFLIVAPTSLIYNWENEFNKFGDKISYVVINNDKETRIEMLKKINKYDVIITTYGLLRRDIEEYQKLNFDTFIIDEAQNIKNSNAITTKCIKQISATTKFALTGTPIENSVLELWSIFDFIMPGFFFEIAKFRSYYQNNVQNENVMKELNNLVTPFILRRKKIDVLKDLPSKIENNITIELNEKQKKIYFAELEKVKEEIDKSIKQNGFKKSQFLILSLLTKLRQICINPKLYIENYKGESSKYDEVIEILKTSIQNKHKVLLFSQFTSALKLLEPLLKENNISYYYLDGSTKSIERMNLVNKFNEDETNLFLISLKSGGTGLNLTGADVVIHLDPWWNPQVENQATDRAHRIGQKKVVEVIKLIAKGTIEEKILDLQIKKKELSNQIIECQDRDQIMLSKLSEEDFKKMLQI
ncbi:MAG: DEAD/DEAH box helicase [Bacilli bacterium]